MSQISPPIRIVVVAVIGLLAAYMLVLKPKDPVEPPAPAPATAPGMTGLGNAVDNAKDAAGTQEARDAELQKATGGGDEAAAGSAASSAAKTEAALATGRVLTLAPLADEKTKDLPRGIRTALARRDVLAIGVFNVRNKTWDPIDADERRVRRALSGANRYGGRVTVHSATLGDLSQLRPVLGEQTVTQSPSVVVVDRNRKATVLEGYVDRVTINQAIADARRDSIAFRIKNDYLSSANELCGEYALRTDRFQLPAGRSVRPAFRRLDRLTGTYVRRFARLSPPARFKGLHTQMMGALRSDSARVAGARAAANAGNSGRALALLSGADLAAAVALDRRLGRAGLTSCVGNRRS